MQTRDISDKQVCEAYYLSSGCTELFASDYLILDTKAPEKVAYSAMDRAYNHGLIEYGVSLRSGWLTEKGMGLLDSNDKLQDLNSKELIMMNFGEAIHTMRAGRNVARNGWRGKGTFIAIQFPDENSKMTLPYMYKTTTGVRTDNEDVPKILGPWSPSQEDMLTDDWIDFGTG